MNVTFLNRKFIRIHPYFKLLLSISIHVSNTPYSASCSLFVMSQMIWFIAGFAKCKRIYCMNHSSHSQCSTIENSAALTHSRSMNHLDRSSVYRVYFVCSSFLLFLLLSLSLTLLSNLSHTNELRWKILVSTTICVHVHVLNTYKSERKLTQIAEYWRKIDICQFDEKCYMNAKINANRRRETNISTHFIRMELFSLI